MRRFFVIVLIGFNVFISRAHYIKEIGSREGLSHPDVTSVCAGRDGVVWIGTKYGLNRYVNSSLSSYVRDCLEGNCINMVFEDSSGKIWVATESALSLYDRKSDSFLKVCDGTVYCAAEKGDVIYFAGSEVMAFDKETESVSRISAFAGNVRNCHVTSGGILLADKFKGLFLLDSETGTIRKLDIPELEGKFILSSYKDVSGIWAGVYMDGIYHLSEDGKVLDRYTVSDNPRRHIEVICDIKRVDSRLWFATDGGGICTISEGKVVPLKSIPGYADFAALPSAITTLMQDSFSNIWAGSVRDGLFGIMPTSIIHYSGQEGGAGYGGLNNHVILDICHDDRYVWLATDGGGVNRYCPATGEFADLPSTRNEIISSMCLLGRDDLLISIYCKGLFRVNRKTGAMTPFPLVNGMESSREIFSGHTPSLFEAQDDMVLIAGESVYQYNVGNGTFSFFSSDFGVNPSDLHPFHYDRDNSVTYAFSHTGIYMIDNVRGRISSVCSPQGGVRINTATCMKGRIYIGTDSGLMFYDLSKRRMKENNSGLFNRVTYVGERDGDRLWIGADGMLLSYDTVYDRYEVYDEAEGFAANDISAGTPMNGLFYFGGSYGMTVVPAGICRRIVNNPSLALVQMTSEGKPVEVPADGRLNLSPSAKPLELSFEMSGGDPFRSILLRYDVEGSGALAVETYSTTFTVPQLPPGNYSVTASYLMSDGRWSEGVRFLDISVPDHFWRTGWFLCILLLTMSAILIMVTRSIRRRADMRLGNAIRQNLTDEKKKRSRFIKAIDSEIRVPISQIGEGLNSLLASEVEMPEKVRGKLDRLYANSLKLEKTVSDTIEQERDTGEEKEESPLLSKLDAVIDEHIADCGLDVSMLVREVAMSRSILYEKVKEAAGVGINEYIRKRRLVQARRCLIETDLSVADISDMFGFSSPKYFTVVFKEAYGISPRDLRKKLM